MRTIIKTLICSSLVISSCEIAYFDVVNIPHTEHINPEIIPAEGGVFDFYLVEYEHVEIEQQIARHKCYRYRLNIEENVGEESEDYNVEMITVEIPQNTTGKNRNIVIEIKIAEEYHHDVGKPCHQSSNKFGEWEIAWSGTQNHK